MNQYRGECLCGSCRYVIKGEKPKAMYLCQCSRCRKETGTIHGANVFFENSQLLWEKWLKSSSNWKEQESNAHFAIFVVAHFPDRKETLM